MILKNSHRNFKTIIILGLLILFISSMFAAPNLEKKITLSAEDSSISQVLSIIAKQGNCNIVLSTDLVYATDNKTREELLITINLTDVPLEQALSLVVKAVGLTYRLVGDNTFLIGTKARIDSETGERSYIIPLNNVDPSKVVNALKILPGQAVPIEGQNAILVKANPDVYADIIKRVEEIDQPLKQIEIRARLIEINIKQSEKFGIDWSRLDHLTTIIAEDPIDAEGNGLPYNFYDIETPELPSGDLSAFATLPEEQYWQKMKDWDDVAHFSRQLTAFDITIDWLVNNNAAKLLTDTRVTALNGQQATIHIGEIIPYVVSSSSEDIKVQKENVGVMLTVLPTVNFDNQITTKIIPEVSSIVELIEGKLPRKKIRRVESTVTVPNGKKIIVGGLLMSDSSKKVNKLPFLGDIPFIGKLFTHKYEVVNNTDLVIEITPRLVNIEEQQNKKIMVDPKLERPLIEYEETTR